MNGPNGNAPRAVWRRVLDDHLAAVRALDDGHAAALERLAAAVRAAWDGGGRLLVCGNGGSAADAQHIVAELVGRFERDRPGWPALALTVNTSVLTAVANDHGFAAVFARQVEALGRPGDVLLAISTSGRSPNCLAAVAAARERGLVTAGFTGGDGGELTAAVDIPLVAPAAVTARIQEIHILWGHLLCALLEAARDGEAGT